MFQTISNHLRPGCRNQSVVVSLGEEDHSPTYDLSRVRDDIIEQALKFVPEGQMLQEQFMTEHPHTGIDFSGFLERKRIGHQRYLRGEDATGLISEDETLYYAKLSRYVSEGYTYVKEPIPEDVIVTHVDVNGVPAEWQDCGSPDMDKVILYIHGGSFVSGSAKNHRILTFPIGRLSRTRVLSIDYRLAPEHPFPAQLEDTINAYSFLLDSGTPPSHIILMGFSAGGTIVLSLLGKLKEEGWNFPAGVVLKSPATDFSSTYPSYVENASLDLTIGEGGRFLNILAYISAGDPTDPLVSPIRADMSGYPPLLVQVGTHEVLYDECKQLVENARSVGVEATLQEFPEMFHSWYLLNIAETHDAFEKIADFVRACLVI